MSETAKKLIATLQAIFEMDKADLDFGIYRIMNQKRDEINRFLENDLLPQVNKAFADFGSEGQADLQQELNTAIEQAKSFGSPDPENAPAVLEIKKKMANAVDVKALENDVFSKLHTFFSRYYDKGDFISQRRYKADTYAIPYEGEEVKLYWANHDQYYIKSSEHLRDYAFIAKDPNDKDRPVRIKLIEADTEKDNIKAKSGEERRFILDEGNPLSIEENELRIHFNFVPAGKQTQDALNKKAVEAIFKIEDQHFSEWLAILKSPAPTESNPNRTVLEKHLYDYTARNTFDYFIHKDLGGFLNRELDFFIKNEVMHLDDIDDEAFELTQQQLRKVKVLRAIAKKIIRMLSQIEDFQKKLWMKKKFVIKTDYCFSLDNIPSKYLDKICECDCLLNYWKNEFGINKENMLKAVSNCTGNAPISNKYAKLPVDTKYLESKLVDQIISSFSNINESLTGVLINSENFQALSLLKERMKGNISSIYIDPPYNTDASPILYKNGFRSSSWTSMMSDRLKTSYDYLDPNGLICLTIDDFQFRELSWLVESIYGEDSILGTATIRNNPAGRSTKKGFAIAHEYAIFARKSDTVKLGRLPHSEKQQKRYKEEDEAGKFEWVNFRKHGGANANRSARRKLYYPILITEENVRIPKLEWNEADEEWKLLEEPQSGESIVYPVTEEGDEKTWKWEHFAVSRKIGEFSVRPDQSGKPYVYVKSRINEEGTLPLTIWADSKYSASDYGTNLLKSMFPGEQAFSFPKSIHSVEDSLLVSGQKDSKDGYVLDFFAGSGTTGHAVMNLNKADGGSRKFLLVEMGQYFDTVLKSRILKSYYSDKWKNGKPVIDEKSDNTRPPMLIKCQILETYEDALNNLMLKSKPYGDDLLSGDAALREDYMLGYWLELDTEKSASLFDIERFENPFEYKMEIGCGSAAATKPTRVDLIETFNYLIGLSVKTVDVIRDFKIVTGTNPKGESVLVVWRIVKQSDNTSLEEFLDKQGYNPRDTEFENIYVNGDHTLEDPHSKVKMIEIEFKRLMFDVKDV